MPVIITEVPVLEKLQPQLFAHEPGFQPFTIDFWLDPSGAKTGAYYRFHDSLWIADLRHMLGWSRETIHSLKASSWMLDIFKSRSMKPKWLYGHAFEWMNDGTYRASASGRRYSIEQMIHYAIQTQEMLEGADVHTDQWGGKTHEEWNERIKYHNDLKCNPGHNKSGYLLARYIRGDRSDIEFHTIMANWGNAHYHPSYPIKGPVMSSGVQQGEANTILNNRFENSSATGPATIFANLRSSTPSDTTTGTLAAYTSYAAVSVTCNTTNFPAASAGVITLAIATTWPTNTGSTETEVAMTFDTSAAGTTNLYWGTFASQAIANGNTPQANANSVSVSAV